MIKVITLFSLRVALIATAFSSVSMPHSAYAAIPEVYTNDNYLTATHDKPVVFYRDHLGRFYGETETGKLFRQYPITNELGVKLQRFEIDEAFFYISDRGVIWASDDLAALSIYVSRA